MDISIIVIFFIILILNVILINMLISQQRMIVNIDSDCSNLIYQIELINKSVKKIEEQKIMMQEDPDIKQKRWDNLRAAFTPIGNTNVGSRTG